MWQSFVTTVMPARVISACWVSAIIRRFAWWMTAMLVQPITARVASASITRLFVTIITPAPMTSVREVYAYSIRSAHLTTALHVLMTTASMAGACISQLIVMIMIHVLLT